MLEGLEGLPGYRITDDIGVPILAFTGDNILTATTKAQTNNLLGYAES